MSTKPLEVITRQPRVKNQDTCVSLVPIFKGLTPKQQLEVARFARPVHAKPGEQLQAAGQRRGRLFVVHSGRVRLVHLNSAGQEQVIRMLGTGDVLGEASFILGRGAEHFAFADTDTTMCSFEHADLAKLVASYPDIAVRMLQSATDRLMSAERKIAAFSSTDVGTRLAGYLLDLPIIDDGAAVRLPMAKKDVASFLGTTPETLSRRLAEFVDAGVIAMSGRRDIRILDADALEQRARA